ncbi:hypothetical protein MSAN_00013800 [Mycena sanguinolenta]|uniref:DNA repair and recombination protein RAD54B n=1 Tax=Mycena sanguinolenta TaxID=230812 RepID=A0A8H6ZE29_9AGAR|nr:hypothetical protein MSAN_00013800 [Mycena sanguinolenta]
MPAFQTLKRKSDADDQDTSRKRTTLDADSEDHYWVVQWRNYQAKKHKTWDGDGVLVVTGPKSTLYDSDGKTIASGKRGSSYFEGLDTSIGGKDIQLDRPITRSEFLSGTCFGDSMSYSIKPSIPSHAQPSTSAPERKHVPLQPVDLLSTISNKSPKKALPVVKTEARDSYWTANWRKPGQNKKHKTWDGDAFVSNVDGKLTMITEEGKVMGTTAWKGDQLYGGYHTSPLLLVAMLTTSRPPAAENPSSVAIGSPAPTVKTFVAPTSFYGPQVPSKPKPKGPLHDPTAEGAIVMKGPTKDHIKRFNKKFGIQLKAGPPLPINFLSYSFVGVKFMYECVMGLRKHEGQGCILADEMGLGKTLQTITLIWTVLKQNPYAGAGPVVGKVLIVCPVSLINNWKVEFHKWLGRDRLGVVTGDKDKNAIKTFQNAKNQQVLIIGYERLRTVMQVHSDQLAYCVPPIGLIVCDEGHRLKSANNKTTTMFEALRTTRRIILSGTPVQNDLGEFHAMATLVFFEFQIHANLEFLKADFCNPGLLDNYATFRRVYETPILKSRAPDSSEKERQIGEARLAQLLTIAKSFVLRRDASLLQNYLPSKRKKLATPGVHSSYTTADEYVVFVTPTPLQISIFSKILNPNKLDDLAQSSTAESLALINMLTKVSNSPILLKATVDKQKAEGSDARNAIKRAGVDDALKLLPENAQVEDVSLSGKLIALSKLLKAIYQDTEEKCVLVSHYTSTLNILEAFCKKKNYSFYRLDGQTPAAKRQEYVNSFNKSTQRSSFIFLLSSKAGGVGINLIGGSRLCLIDSDWNPSHDLQSMARCHRDGQKRPVFIYRFLTAGAIDEKIYQRQVTKLGLSNSLMGSSSSIASSKSDSFSRKDVRISFRIHPNTACNTHDLLECPCDGTAAMNNNENDDLSIESDSEDDGFASERKGFVNAAQIQPEEIDKMDKAYMEKKRAGLAALGQWKHINCLLPTARNDIHDSMLRKLLFVPQLEKPQSQLLAILDAATTMASMTVSDLPGGSVSFLFEKNTSSATVESGDSP